MKFYKIYLELSDICHLKCSFCKPKKAVRGLMPLALFDTITSQIQNKTRLVSLHILGDPLCIDNLATYLDIAEQKKNITLKKTIKEIYRLLMALLYKKTIFYIISILYLLFINICKKIMQIFI